MELINISNVSYSYSDGNLALKNLNMTISQGEKVAILGPNGAGKSTLFHLFNGLLQPTAGSVTIDGLDTSKKTFH